MKANQFKKAVSYFALASVFTMAGCQKDDALENNSAAAAPDQAMAADNGKVIEDQYIVVLNEGENAADVMKTGKISASDIKDKFEGSIKGFTAKLSDDQIETLRNSKDVKSIEQDRMITLTDPSSAVAQPAQAVNWGASRVGYGDGTGKTAWVIDSGVDPNHPDLNVDTNKSMCFITGVTSYVDGYGHGTGVAGIIGAKNNTIGTVGVAANATIIALRVFDDLGRGSVSSAIKAVNHVIANGKAGDVVNMSLGSGISSTLDNAVKSAAAKGIFFAIAAGNTGIDCSASSPARVNAPNVYTVSAMNQSGALSGFSNYGAPVDYAAPGEGIVTTYKNGTYTQGGGTSFAAPHVAGLLLLRGNAINSRGTVTGDKDSTPDPIPSL